MSKVIKDLVQDIKIKIKESDKDIRKAIEKKDTDAETAEFYYQSSINKTNEVLELHKIVIDKINHYRKEHGDPPKTMLDLWEWQHREIIEEVAEIKLLQKFFTEL